MNDSKEPTTKMNRKNPMTLTNSIFSSLFILKVSARRTILYAAAVFFAIAATAIPSRAEGKLSDKEAEAIVATLSGGAIIASSQSLEVNTQIVDQYRVQNNKHGYAAEDANALSDKMKGHKVENAGRDNASDGPDRVVNGEMIQTKYGKSAEYNVSTAFDKKTGKYRYPGQRLEVPKDQYEKAVELMRERIKKGDVPGVDDPNMAEKIVKKGHFTYDQAVRVAKAGNIESIKFDIKTGAVTCLSAAGLSFVLVYANDIINGMDPVDAVKHAGNTCGVTAIVTMAAHVSTSQILRMESADGVLKKVEQFSEKAVGKIRNSKVGRTVLDKAVTGLTKETGERAIVTAGRRLLTSSAVSAVVTTVIITSADVIEGINGKKEWSDVGKDAAANVAGTAGGLVGGWGGAALGTAICPGVGTVVGGIVGSLVVGIGCSYGVHEIMDCIIEPH